MRSVVDKIDGSVHRWFEGRSEPHTLQVFIDNATSKLMQLRFVHSESTRSYFETLQGLSCNPCCPIYPGWEISCRLRFTSTLYTTYAV